MEEVIRPEGPEVFSCWTGIEAKTGEGQIISLSCRPDEVGEVKKFFQEKIKNVSLPETRRVKGNSGFCQLTRYDITQHRYVGSDRGYIELLEIKDLPENCCGFIINEYELYNRSFFTEWDKMEDAIVAFDSRWGSCNNDEVFPKMKGFKRIVYCNDLTPWFYAVGEEEIMGDYAFPQGLQDDPVYRVGEKFVVYDRIDGIHKIKTCMGARVCLTKDAGSPNRIYHYRFVYWDDGSIYDGSGCNGETSPPRPINENEEWITKAMGEFYQVLSGKKTSFSVDFTDGNKFVGKIRPANKSSCAEGRYYLKVTMKRGKARVFEGYVDFKPTPENPNIVQYVANNHKRNRSIAKIEVVKSDITPGGKKWAGVYFAPDKFKKK